MIPSLKVLVKNMDDPALKDHCLKILINIKTRQQEKIITFVDTMVKNEEKFLQYANLIYLLDQSSITQQLCLPIVHRIVSQKHNLLLQLNNVFNSMDTYINQYTSTQQNLQELVLINYIARFHPVLVLSYVLYYWPQDQKPYSLQQMHYDTLVDNLSIVQLSNYNELTEKLVGLFLNLKDVQQQPAEYPQYSPLSNAVPSIRVPAPLLVEFVSNCISKRTASSILLLMFTVAEYYQQPQSQFMVLAGILQCLGSIDQSEKVQLLAKNANQTVYFLKYIVSQPSASLVDKIMQQRVAVHIGQFVNRCELQHIFAQLSQNITRVLQTDLQNINQGMANIQAELQQLLLQPVALNFFELDTPFDVGGQIYKMTPDQLMQLSQRIYVWALQNLRDLLAIYHRVNQSDATVGIYSSNYQQLNGQFELQYQIYLKNLTTQQLEILPKSKQTSDFYYNEQMVNGAISSGYIRGVLLTCTQLVGQLLQNPDSSPGIQEAITMVLIKIQETDYDQQLQQYIQQNVNSKNQKSVILEIIYNLLGSQKALKLVSQAKVNSMVNFVIEQVFALFVSDYKFVMAEQSTSFKKHDIAYYTNSSQLNRQNCDILVKIIFRLHQLNNELVIADNSYFGQRENTLIDLLIEAAMGIYCPSQRTLLQDLVALDESGYSIKTITRLMVYLKDNYHVNVMNERGSWTIGYDFQYCCIQFIDQLSKHVSSQQFVQLLNGIDYRSGQLLSQLLLFLVLRDEKYNLQPIFNILLKISENDNEQQQVEFFQVKDDCAVTTSGITYMEHGVQRSNFISTELRADVRTLQDIYSRNDATKGKLGLFSDCFPGHKWHSVSTKLCCELNSAARDTSDYASVLQRLIFKLVNLSGYDFGRGLYQAMETLQFHQNTAVGISSRLLYQRLSFLTIIPMIRDLRFSYQEINAGAAPSNDKAQHLVQLSTTVLTYIINDQDFNANSKYLIQLLSGTNLQFTTALLHHVQGIQNGKIWNYVMVHAATFPNVADLVEPVLDEPVQRQNSQFFVPQVRQECYIFDVLVRLSMELCKQSLIKTITSNIIGLLENVHTLVLYSRKPALSVQMSVQQLISQLFMINGFYGVDESVAISARLVNQELNRSYDEILHQSNYRQLLHYYQDNQQRVAVQYQPLEPQYAALIGRPGAPEVAGSTESIRTYIVRAQAQTLDILQELLKVVRLSDEFRQLCMHKAISLVILHRTSEAVVAGQLYNRILGLLARFTEQSLHAGTVTCVVQLLQYYSDRAGPGPVSGLLQSMAADYLEITRGVLVGAPGYHNPVLPTARYYGRFGRMPALCDMAAGALRLGGICVLTALANLGPAPVNCCDAVIGSFYRCSAPYDLAMRILSIDQPHVHNALPFVHQLFTTQAISGYFAGRPNDIDAIVSRAIAVVASTPSHTARCKALRNLAPVFAYSPESSYKFVQKQLCSGNRKAALDFSQAFVEASLAVDGVLCAHFLRSLAHGILDYFNSNAATGNADTLLQQIYQIFDSARDAVRANAWHDHVLVHDLCTIAGLFILDPLYTLSTKKVNFECNFLIKFLSASSLRREVCDAITAQLNSVIRIYAGTINPQAANYQLCIIILQIAKEVYENYAREVEDILEHVCGHISTTYPNIKNLPHLKMLIHLSSGVKHLEQILLVIDPESNLNTTTNYFVSVYLKDLQLEHGTDSKSLKQYILKNLGQSFSNVQENIILFLAANYKCLSFDMLEQQLLEQILFQYLYSGNGVQIAHTIRLFVQMANADHMTVTNSQFIDNLFQVYYCQVYNVGLLLEFFQAITKSAAAAGATALDAIIGQVILVIQHNQLNVEQGLDGGGGPEVRSLKFQLFTRLALERLVPAELVINALVQEIGCEHGTQQQQALLELLGELALLVC